MSLHKRIIMKGVNINNDYSNVWIGNSCMESESNIDDDSNKDYEGYTE